MLSKGEAAALLSLINAHHGNAQWDDVQLLGVAQTRG